MKRIIFLAAIVGVGTLLITTTAKASNIKEGQWSMTTTIHMDGMDEQAAQATKEMENMSPEDKAMMQTMMGKMGMNMGAAGGGIATTTTQCLTNDNPVPEASDEEDCQQTHTIRGNTVNFEVVCANSHSTGQVTYKNNNMNGTINSTQTENGKETNATIDISGKYVGPCDENSANSTPRINLPSAQRISDRKLSLKEKELELKRQELELKEKELELDSTGNTVKNKSKSKPTLNDVNNAVNTTNNAKNVFGGFHYLFLDAENNLEFKGGNERGRFPKGEQANDQLNSVP